MKKEQLLRLTAILLLVFSTFTSCNSNDTSTTPSDNNNNPPNPNDMSQYVYRCTNFVDLDSYFLSFLISRGYDLNYDGKISCNEAAQIINLDLPTSTTTASNILLKGIGAFVNLKSITGDCSGWGTDLNLYNNIHLESVKLNTLTGGNYAYKNVVLPNSSSLKVFNCPNLYKKRILNITNQSALETLICRGNDFTPNDSAPSWGIDLSGCTSLKVIDLWGNNLNSITFSQNTYSNLTEINLGGNGYSYNSSGISLSNTIRTSNIDFSKFPNLKKLDLSDDINTNINLSSNNLIEYLNLYSGGVGSILNITNLGNLKYLNLSQCYISALSLPNSAALQELYVDYNYFSTLNLTPYVNLRIFDCRWCPYLQTIDFRTGNLQQQFSSANNLNWAKATNCSSLNCIYIDSNYSGGYIQKDSHTNYCH